jgi:protein SCO1/2
MSSRLLVRWLVALTVALCAPAVSVHAQAGMSSPNRMEIRQADSSMEDRIGSEVDAELTFTDERGYPLKLRKYFPGALPVVLNLGYYGCPDMCGQVIHGMVDALNEIDLDPGTHYEILNVSIDPRETAEVAKQRKQNMLMRFTKVGADAAWRFAVGEPAAVEKLAATVGFRYFWAEHDNRYDHPAALIVLTPQGKVSRVLTGLTFEPKDVRLAILEASEGKLGTFWDKVQLSCLTWDPVTRTYSLTALTVMKVGGALTVAALGVMLFVMFRGERRRVKAASA